MSSQTLEQEADLTKQVVKLPTEEVFKVLATQKTGLTSEAVQENQKKYGKNEIEEAKGTPLIFVFLKNFISLMAILLWVGGAIAIFADMPQLGIAIWLVNLINGGFSFFQEYQAGKATDALKKMLPSYARVIRNGVEDKILAEDLVPGDIILIEEGDKISADARLIQTSDLQVNQSTLTGESTPVRKMSDPVMRDNLTAFETPNLIFAGTSIASGTGTAVVTAIGMATQFGRIAGLTQSMKEEPSPLQKELDRLTKQVSIIAVSVGIFFFATACLFVNYPVAKSFIFALGMVVAFIPEGLLPTVTLSLASAVQRMAKEHALVKKLSSVETLGATTVICSDKTGTLTQNEMTVSNLWLADKELEVNGLGYAPQGEVLYNGNPITASDDQDLSTLLKAASLCSNARIVPPNEENPNYTVLGDPTEACLNVVAEKAGLNLQENEKGTPRLRELPFDSSRKRMSTIHQLTGNDKIAYIKGAPKEILELSTTICQSGQVHSISDEQRTAIMEANDKYARAGLRVLAVAYRLIDDQSDLPRALNAYTAELVEHDMVFVGLIVMADPPRPEVAKAVEECRRASIRIIMITGDYGLTAESIAKRIGIVQGDHPRVITGLELQDMDDPTLQDALKDEVIFARVAPEQKYRVVCNLQEMGNVVAVTGDGVNDAPALKKADIGIAMGITGTDVAKEAADMILTDDNFASIVNAVEEGRTVYNNIQKFLLYILNSNMAEAVPSAAFLFSRGLIPIPLTVMQILAIDLGTDMAPALGLGTEKPEAGIMDKPPRNQKDTLLNRKVVVKAFFWYGLLASLVSMAAYFFVNMKHGWPGVPLAAQGLIYREATTMCFGSIVFAQVAAVMNCRTETQSVFSIGLFSNKRILIGIVIELAVLCLLSYVPVLQNLFETAPLSLGDWIYLICIPIPLFFIEELRKAIVRKRIQSEKEQERV